MQTQPTHQTKNEAITKPGPSPTALRILTILASLALLAGIIIGLTYPGPDSIQGEVQRLFYIHVPSFTGAFIAFSVGVVSGLLYLWKREPRFDRLSVSSIEVGFAFALINMALGSIWARPIWNTWWTSDPRMVTAAIMVITCAGYLFIRQGIADPKKRRFWAAWLSVLLMATVIYTIVMGRIRPDTIHPVVVGPSAQNSNPGMTMDDPIRQTFYLNIAIWGLLVTPAVIWWRLRLETLREYIKARRGSPSA